MAVVNKPQGMVVHPSAGHTSGTLVNALMVSCQDLSSINGVVRPGIVHRIDKRTRLVFSWLLRMIRPTMLWRLSLRTRSLCASMWLSCMAICPNDRGVIEAPIGRSDKDRKKQAVTAKGEACGNSFTVLERFGNYTLVELQLETGRTHQIRVHMAYIGHPVAGDPLYGPRKTLKGHGRISTCQDPWFHASYDWRIGRIYSRRTCYFQGNFREVEKR